MAKSDAEHTVDPASSVDCGSLFDPESGLASETLLRFLVRQRVTAARERLGQLWVAVVTARGTGGVPGAPSPALVGEVLVAALADANVVARLDDGRYAVLFDNVKERVALTMLSELPATVEGRCPQTVVHAGLAAYPQHGFDADELLVEAGDALIEAQTWPIARIEVAPVPR